MVPFYGTFQGFECGGCATDVCFKAANIGIDADIDGSSRWSELVVVLSDAHAHVVLKKKWLRDMQAGGPDLVRVLLQKVVNDDCEMAAENVEPASSSCAP